MPFPIRSFNDLDDALQEIIDLSGHLSTAHVAALRVVDEDQKRELLATLGQALKSTERLFDRVQEARAKQSSRF
jgi:hypothetical protein